MKVAEAEAAGLNPDMRAFVLWRASYAYTKLDPVRSQKLALDAFTATQAMGDAPDHDMCAQLGSAGDTKSWIQQQILYAMVRDDKVEQVEALLPQATAPVRDETTTELVRHYIAKKNLARAEALLAQLGDSERYPFGAAAQLISAMGPELSADRMMIFNQALTNFQDHPQSTGFSMEDFGGFIERTWQAVPPELALEAIGKVLDTAKSQNSHAHYSMSSAKGTVVLNSTYDLRLFQLLPILEQLDNDKAQTLLRERSEVANQLQNYPKGMQSLNTQNTSFSYGISDNDSPITKAAAQQQAAAQISERLDHIRAEAAKQPDIAFSDALAMPVNDGQGTSPRVNALLAVARITATKNPRVAKSALDELLKTQDQWSIQQPTTLADLPSTYLQRGDEDGATKAVAMLAKAAEALYRHDIDADDPNKAFKGAWPSTDLWRKCLQEAVKISPTLPEEIIAGLDDPDIAAYERVIYASSLLGGSGINAPIAVADCRKNGSSYRISY